MGEGRADACYWKKRRRYITPFHYLQFQMPAYLSLMKKNQDSAPSDLPATFPATISLTPTINHTYQMETVNSIHGRSTEELIVYNVYVYNVVVMCEDREGEHKQISIWGRGEEERGGAESMSGGGWEGRQGRRWEGEGGRVEAGGVGEWEDGMSPTSPAPAFPPTYLLTCPYHICSFSFSHTIPTIHPLPAPTCHHHCFLLFSLFSYTTL